MKNYKLTYLLLALLITVGTVSFTNLKGRVKTTTPPVTQPIFRSQNDEVKKRNFPTADFNEEGPTEPTKRVAFKEKQKRHNGLGLVNKKPDADSGGGVIVPEGQFDFPALPVNESDAIVLGQIVSAEAHLSEDKSNVFSEFEMRVERFLNPGSNPQNGALITVERIGGYVQYPDGRKLLYRVGSAGMPAVGARYVLFLKGSTSENFTILTGYQLSTKGVLPLDSSRQFEAFGGYDEIRFLSALNDALSKAQTKEQK